MGCGSSTPAAPPSSVAKGKLHPQRKCMDNISICHYYFIFIILSLLYLHSRSSKAKQKCVSNYVHVLLGSQNNSVLTVIIIRQYSLCCRL